MELVRFTTKDNLVLHGLLAEPKPKPSKAVVHVHGWVGNFYENQFLDAISQSVIAKNMAFFTFNNRGAGIVAEFSRAGKRENIGGSLEIFEECMFDIEAALNLLQKRGYSEIILQGHSLGCQKIVYYQHIKKDKRVHALVFLAPVDDAEFAAKHQGQKYKESLAIAKEMVKNGKGKEQVPKWMQYYPLLTANMFLQVSDSSSASGRILDYSGKLVEIKNLALPILAIFGSRDNFQSEPKKALDILQRAVACDAVLIGNADHWFSGHEKEMAKHISEWIRKL